MKTEMYIDLHLHLDGSISISSARMLASISGISLPEKDDDLKKLLTCPADCQNLNDYLNCFELPCKLMQTPETVKLAAYNLCAELKEKGYIYAEIRFAPQKHTDCGMTQDDVVCAAIEGIKKSGLCAGLILCCMRGNSNERENIETVRLAKKYLGNIVCAVDLAGAEALFPNEIFQDLFVTAKNDNIPFTIHSGEASGAGSVKTAIEFGARRIGHGVRSVDDPDVINLLKEKKITLELCPTSNINTRIFGNIKEMPFEFFDKNGVLYTVNSDNMAVSDTDVEEEMALVKDAFRYEKSFEKKMLLNAANAAFCSESTRKKLIRKIKNNYIDD